MEAPLRVVPPAARSDMDDVPAAEEAEQPVPERGAEVDNNEVIIDGLRLTPELGPSEQALVVACESLGMFLMWCKQSASSVQARWKLACIIGFVW